MEKKSVSAVTILLDSEFYFYNIRISFNGYLNG
jgi:hypothetical protein